MIGLIPSAKGMTTWSLSIPNIPPSRLASLPSPFFLPKIASRVPLITALPKFLRGSTDFFKRPTKPPIRLPSGPCLPKTASLNESVVVTKPAAEPSNAFPSKPKGPRNAPARAPSPIAGSAFLSFSFFLGSISPPSPKRVSCIRPLFLAKPAADPISNPPTGPNGVIRPARVPSNPNFLISGIAFCNSLLRSPSS